MIVFIILIITFVILCIILIVKIIIFITHCIKGFINFKTKFEILLKYNNNPKDSPIITKNLKPEYVNMKKKTNVKIAIIVLNIMSITKVILLFLHFIFFFIIFSISQKTPKRAPKTTDNKNILTGGEKLIYII